MNIEKEISWLLKEKYNNNLPAGRQGQKQFKKDVKRLEKGEPVDYVIGFTEFLGCKIDLSKKILIPRPETEFWVKQVIEEIRKDKRKYIKCLDMFAGSGCIGIAVIKNLLRARRSFSEGGCDFADKEKNAIAQIKINCKLNNIDKKRYKVIQSDIFKAKPAFAKSFGEAKYDFIFANPPYIAITRKNKIQKSVLKYEPKQALFGGKDGLVLIDRFLKESQKHLNEQGKIFMEFDYIQKKQIEKLLKKYKYNSWEFKKDQYGKWRWVVVF